MHTTKQGRIAAWLLAIMLAGATVAFAEDSSAPVEAEEDDAVPAGVSYSLEATGGYFNVNNAYFVTDSKFDWMEGFARARGFYGFGHGAYVTAGGVVMATLQKDYYGNEDVNDGLLDQLALSMPDINGSGFGFTVGRQSLTLGDGFLIGDGYRDHFAAFWSIPLSFYDGVSVNWAKGPHHVTAFAVDLSPSFTVGDVRPEGIVAGGEFGWSPSEGNELAVAFLRRNDTSDIDYNPQAISVRGSHTRGPVSFAGEAVLESGSMGTTDMAGKGGHLDVAWNGEGTFKPTLKAQYFLFSGDDPDTEKDESYDPWQYTWSDWSSYYVGDLVASTVGSSSDMRSVVLQAGITPREGTGLRLLAHRFDHDKGDTKPFAYEFDLILDQSFGERFSAYVMAAHATPLDAAKLEWGEEAATQVFASVTWKFSGRLAQ